MVASMPRPHTEELDLAREANAKLVTQVKQALKSSNYAQLQDANISARNGRVTLQGKVSSFYIKQMAQTIVLGVDGVAAVQNDLNVSCGKP